MARSHTIDDAARLSGRSSREIRVLIEDGRLPAHRVAGRWMVAREDLKDLVDGRRVRPAAEETRPPVQGNRPLGAMPEPPPGARPALNIVAGTVEPLSELLARLEQSAVDLAAVTAERDSLKVRLSDEVEALEQSYSAARAQLEEARGRIAELEARGLSETVKGPSRGQGARAALDPLFRATAPPRASS